MSKRAHTRRHARARARASTAFGTDADVDGRVKPGHDGVSGAASRCGDRSRSSSSSSRFATWVVSLGPLPLDEARQVSTTIVDRNGKLLRAYAMADGRWRLPVDARTNVDPTYLEAAVRL